MKRKCIKFGRKALNLLRYQPTSFLTRAKANIVLPFLPTKSCEISVNGARFHIDPSLGPMVKEMCYGYYENELTALLKQYIRKGDVCVDVGANIGYISAFMLGLVGKSGAVHSFEPVPEYYQRLSGVQQDNPDLPLTINAVALGDFDGTSRISVNANNNIGWNTLVPGFMDKASVKAEIEIPVKRLDDYLLSKNIRDVRLIKIDTEGYELPVLDGLKNFLDKTESPPILIAEIAPNAYPKLGRSLSELADYMNQYGYVAKDVLTRKEVDVSTLEATSNVIFTHPDYH